MVLEVVIAPHAISRAQRRGVGLNIEDALSLAAQHGHSKYVKGPGNGRVLRVINDRVTATLRRKHPDLSSSWLESLRGTAVITQDMETADGVQRLVVTVIKDQSGSLHQIANDFRNHARWVTGNRKLRNPRSLMNTSAVAGEILWPN